MEPRRMSDESNGQPASGGQSSPEGQPNPGGQGSFSAGKQIADLPIERELSESYLTYAMSTIMDRALPDVRDGLKPSQRRILVAMNDLRLSPSKKHLKCAKICGDTSGNYHPHGEAIVYPTLVNMAQKWRMRNTLIDPQGNFGSIDPDPPAAMRYTEARLTHAATDLLADLELDTVDMQPNFDDRLEEPTVLPGKFPNLLINGGIGIAVGMATSLSPNNPTEVLDSIIRVLDNPAISLAELMQDAEGVRSDGSTIMRRGIKGPDFPTGGIIMGRRGIVDAYETGRGKVVVRGIVHVEPVPGSKDRQQIVIDTIPFNLGKRTLTERIVDAVKEDLLTDISDVRDESGREAMVRIVVELKKGAEAGVVEKQLYAQTQLQQNFSMANIALVNRQPRTLSLKELIGHYIDHRKEVIRRRTMYLLGEARRKAHVLEGMIYAVCDIDEVIAIIRSSRTRVEAIERLMARRFAIPAGHPYAPMLPSRLIELLKAAASDGGVILSRIQAETIGNMRLIQLVGLEIEKLAAEYREVVAEIERYEAILASETIVRGMIKADCEQMRDRYDSPRLTEVQDAEGDDLSMAALIPVSDCVVTITHGGYAKRVPADTYRAQGRGGKGIIGNTSKDDDYVEHLFVASTHDDLLCFTNTGRVFKMKVYELPEMDRTAKGRSLINMIELKAGEKVRALLAVKDFEAGSNYLTFLSSRGIIKRTALKAYKNVHKGGLIAVDIREDDRLLDVCLTSGNDDVLLATAGGMAIRFPESDARDMGRQAGGVRAMDLAEGDEIVGVVAIPMDGPTNEATTLDPTLTLLTITRNGFGKRTAVDEYRVNPEVGKPRSQSRGGKGRTDIETDARNGPSVAALAVHESDDVMVISKMGQMVRMRAADIRQISRGTKGVRVVSLHEGDEVVDATRLPGEAAANSAANSAAEAKQAEGEAGAGGSAEGGK
jgi:DNA gyrase subunit A